MLLARPLLASAGQELLHRGDLCLPSTPPDQDDNSRMLALRAQREDIVAVTGYEHAPPLRGYGGQPSPAIMSEGW